MRRLHAAHLHSSSYAGAWDSTRCHGLWVGGFSCRAGDNLNGQYLYAEPFINPVTRIISEIGCHVYSPRLDNMRFGIYEDNGYKYPGRLVADFGTLYGSQGAHWLTGLNAVLRQNKIYWAVMISDVINTNPTSQLSGCYTHEQLLESSFTMRGCCLRVAQASGPLPDPFPAGATSYPNVIYMLMR